jgi:hypothetical protein
MGDFNNDGRADTLWWNESLKGAAVYLTEPILNSVGNPNALGYWYGSPGSGWSYSSIADVNGDHRMDVLFQDALGATAALISNSTATVGSPQYIGTVDTSLLLI